MQTVDRNVFIVWTEGFLLDFKNGKGVVVPEADCLAAQEALDRGEKIGLTRKGKIVTYMVATSDGYYEEIAD